MLIYLITITLWLYDYLEPECWRRDNLSPSDEKFDAVLLDLHFAHAHTEEVVPGIHSLRPSLLANVLVITGDVADAKTLDLIERRSWRSCVPAPSFRQSTNP